MCRGLPASKPWKICTFTPGKKCGRRMLGDRTAQALQCITSSTERSSVSSGPSSCQPSPSKNQAASSPRARIAACNGLSIASA